MTVFVVQRDTADEGYPAFSEIVAAYRARSPAEETVIHLNSSPDTFGNYCVTEIEVK